MFAHITNGTVDLVVSVPPQSIFGQPYASEFVPAPAGVAVGWLWSGGKFFPPPDRAPAVPQTVTRAQGKAALIQAGFWPGVTAFVAAIEDDTQRALAEVALHDTQEWQRSSPFLAAAAEGLGISPEQLDALFVAASEIQL